MDRDEWVRIKSRYDEVVRATKESFAGFPYTPSSRSALELDDEERTAIYEALWEEGGFKFLWGGFFDLLLDERANETAAEFIRRSEEHTSELQSLMRISYAVFCMKKKKTYKAAH